MIKTSLSGVSSSLTSSLTFRNSTGSSGSTSAVALIQNFNKQISSDKIQVKDPTKKLSNVLTNMIKVIDPNDNSIKGEILIDPDNDISIDTSNSDYNLITITLPSSDFNNLNSIFTMY